MKALYIIIIAALCAVALCGLLSHHVYEVCEELVQLCDQAIQAAGQRDLDTARSSLKRFEESWEKRIDTWEMFCDHDDLRQVTIALGSAVIYCEQQDLDQLQIECAYLRMAVIHVWEKEMLRLEHII